MELHRNLGAGVPESDSKYALIKELEIRNIYVKYPFKVPLFYKGSNSYKEFYIDLLVQNESIIEVKAVESVYPVHSAQLLLSEIIE